MKVIPAYILFFSNMSIAQKEGVIDSLKGNSLTLAKNVDANRDIVNMIINSDALLL